MTQTNQSPLRSDSASTTKAQHTPGMKWNVLREHGGRILVIDQDEDIVATVDKNWHELARNDLARLIAAAPDLLAACKGLINAYAWNAKANNPNELQSDV